MGEHVAVGDFERLVERAAAKAAESEWLQPPVSAETLNAFSLTPGRRPLSTSSQPPTNSYLSAERGLFPVDAASAWLRETCYPTHGLQALFTSTTRLGTDQLLRTRR
ncbi:hypothetical protein ACVWZD_000333 [Streptomyces sp. TE3672]